MKRKIPKILGVSLALMLALSLALAAMPISADPGTVKWETVKSPSASGKLMIEDADVDFLAVAPDGSTMFAYDNPGIMTLGRGAIAAGDTSWDDAKATEEFGTHSALLSHLVTSDSDLWVQFFPDAGTTVEDLQDDLDAPNTTWNFYYWLEDTLNDSGPNLELRFRDPAHADRFVDLTVMATQGGTFPTVGAWTPITLANATESTGYWGVDVTGGVYSAGAGQSLEDAIDACIASDSAFPTYVLTSVKVQLIEAIDRDCWIDDITIDGKTYAVGDTGTLYKSTNAGDTWTTTNIGDNLEGSNRIVALVVSPDYANDTTVVAAEPTKVWISINGGKTFGERGTTDLQTLLDDNVITSLDAANYYDGGALAILVGVSDTDSGEYGDVLLFRSDTAAWDEPDDDAIGNFDVVAVAFSPNHRTDGQIIAVAHNEADLYIKTHFGNRAWDADLDAGKIDKTNPFNPTSAVIAFPDDYEWSSNNRILIGTTGPSDYDDVWLIKGSASGSTSEKDLAVSGTDTQTEIRSIAVAGNYVGASVFVGKVNSTTVRRTSDPSVSTVTWSSSKKGPTGQTGTDVVVAVSPNYATDSTVYAVTTDGADNEGTAFSVSTDGGVIFNQTALISVSDISDSTNITFLDLEVVDADTMFLIVHDDGADAAASEMLFRTTDGGSSWQRIKMEDGLAFVKASADYATDSTVFVAESGTTRIWQSPDGGDRWVALASAETITAFAVLDKNVYFTGHDDRMYRSGRWNYDDIGGDIAQSIHIIDEDTVLVGTNDGDVFLSKNASASTGVSYTRQGSAEDLGDACSIQVIPDPDYADNSTIYAGTDLDDDGYGIHRWVVGSSTAWKLLDDDDDDGGRQITALAISDDGTLYAADVTADESVVRVLSPTSSTAWVTEELNGSDMTWLTDGTALDVEFVAGSNTLYAMVGGVSYSTYEHKYRISVFEDTMAIAPTLDLPKDGATVGTSPDLSWRAVESPVTVTYKVELSYDSGFKHDVDLDTSSTATCAETSGTSYPLTGLTAGEVYYWRISVQTGKPLRSLTAKRSFTVKLGTPTVKSPPYGDDDVLLLPTFSWLSVSGADSYQLQMAESATFIGAEMKLTEHSVYTWPDKLDYSTIYYWRVRAIAGGTESSWSEAVFTTKSKPVAPTPPVIVKPAPAAPELPTIVIESPPAPGYIWVIIGVGAILVIAVIVLIVKTRRV